MYIYIYNDNNNNINSNNNNNIIDNINYCHYDYINNDNLSKELLRSPETRRKPDVVQLELHPFKQNPEVAMLVIIITIIVIIIIIVMFLIIVIIELHPFKQNPEVD